MARRYAAAGAETSGVSLHRSLGVPLVDGHPCTELGTRPDAELAVHAREIGLDGLRAHERGRRHFAVCQSAGRELRDTQLCCRQLVWRAVAQADPRKLALHTLGPVGGAEALEDLKRFPERVGRGALPVCPTL